MSSKLFQTYDSTDINAFAEEVLLAHNSRRMRHGSPPLRLDEQLSEQSQRCAQNLLGFEYVNCSPFPNVGENICIIGTDNTGYMPQGEHPVHFWYQQKDIMIFGKEPFNHHTYNFSQVVWKATQLLGVGIARTYNKIVIVCHYSPPGNILGEYVKNVFAEDEMEAETEKEKEQETERVQIAVEQVASTSKE